MYKYPYGDSQQLNLDWILAKLKELEDAAGRQIADDLEVISNALISATFSSSQAYNRSDIVFHDGKLYRANVNILAPGESWNPAHWDEILLGDTVANVVRYISSLNNTQVFNSSTVPGTHTSDALDNLRTDISGLTSSKAEFLNLGNIDSTVYTTRPAQIEQALNLINIYDKPVIFYYTSQGRWSGIALKYTGGQNGYIIASYPNDNNTYFGYLVNSVFTSHRFAGSSTDTTNVSNVTGSTVTDALNNLKNAINSVTEDVSEIGTEYLNDATVTLPSQTFTTINTLTLPAGTWIITGYVNATEAFTEAFYCRLLKNNATITRENLDGRGGGGISLAALNVISTGTATFTLYAYQGTSASKTVVSRFQAVRIKGV